ncbi:MAG TPA: hydroxymethylglutaryl-CoA reductase, degradative [Candidatus Poseidoniales archaeon]|nr:MAG: hydroxymethylglutaryl-CoA reductase, degradative [Euryarchaeota archaeon]HIA25710.1 hydroxymethylglutaryl-CoA reductase, degradative [Candidatus Poseidoniales archaeon]PXY76958.1 MAG: hydroxymethylglutaryl-CoA reductase, degradative [Euryarchaeota archaeon]PXY79077.1 MAG: hydroxymethylglutaryl-CoA reductase, degradative [Euryarchaeota archaeon]HIB23823.1 hydroxymethylglutaryl-CoA reductase, degradative [Candidatus Poseidoniales archaeon]
MPVDNSRLKGFYKLSVKERRDMIAELAGLDQEAVDALAAMGELSESAADRIIENVVGTLALPVGVATNFIVDGDHYLVPFALEEPSVVAAASNMAKRCHATGGFVSNNTEPIMIGQIQVVGCEDPFGAKEAVLSGADELISACNEVDPILVKFGGGCKGLEARVIDTDSGPMVIVHILVDCRDAMGANAVNTMAETIAPKVERITGGTVILRIISNLAVHRLAKVSATFTPSEMANTGETVEEGAKVIEGILQAYHFAAADPFRATTHNKGIMNAISAIAVACGQDWRAIESGAHSYASHERVYGSLTHWEKDGDGNLVGSIELPMAVGLVGGAVRVHPTAKANVAIIGARTADELAKVMAAAGIAQNLGALRALATVGIQAGHMKLHARNMAVTAGANDDEVDKVVEIARASGRITATAIEAALEQVRHR